MTETRFGPLSPHLAARCAPTELDEQTGAHLKGVAHDFSARLLGGVCGIAGVFSTVTDTEKFLRYLLDPTVTSDAPDFGPAWVAESLQPHTGDLEPVRGLFWLPAPGTDPADDIYVHYGFTGTGMWISPKQQRWAVLLTNKIYYSRERQPLNGIRNTFRELVFATEEAHNY
jgi:CubicO group peptidase (beta-lactamase class C family)